MEEERSSTVASSSKVSIPSKDPIVVRLDGLAQTNDALAIREMGRQIEEQEGKGVDEEDDEASGAIVDVSRPDTIRTYLNVHDSTSIRRRHRLLPLCRPNFLHI